MMRLVADSNIADQARDWVFRLSQGESAEKCDDWRASDPAHEEAFASAWSAWNSVAHTAIAQSDAWRTELEQIKSDRWFNRRVIRFGAPAAMAASLAAFILVPAAQKPSEPELVLETPVGQNREISLADGSAVTIGAKSDIKVSFARGRREVVLEHGRAFFQVAHDPDRPFYVMAGNAEIRVVGTKFDVRKVGDKVEVSVLEGRVEVRRKGAFELLGASAPDRILTAGETSVFNPALADSFAPEHKLQVTPGEWRTGRLYYADASLSDIVDEFNRYSSKRVTIGDPAIADQRLTTSFKAGDMEGFLENLEATLDVKTTTRADGAVELRAR
jgi:transmembrane sensor